MLQQHVLEINHIYYLNENTTNILQFVNRIVILANSVGTITSKLLSLVCCSQHHVEYYFIVQLVKINIRQFFYTNCLIYLNMNLITK